MFNLIHKVLRFGEGKKLKALQEREAAVNVLEPEISRLPDEELRAKALKFKRFVQERSKEYEEELKRLEEEIKGALPEERIKLREKLKQVRNKILDPILPEVYAVVREVAKRTINMRHFDVQIMGGVVLHEGKIAEMKTGEGKTLVATLPVYLNALFGKGVHVVTVNDYLAKRDTQWMGPVYHFLGISVGVLQHDAAYLFDPNYPAEDERLKNLRPIERREAYEADVTYGTNTEFGFDYLRDNMVSSLDERVQRGHHYAIVDEVDSILIDEARTPLIISGSAEDRSRICRKVNQDVSRMRWLLVAKDDKNPEVDPEKHEYKYDFVANEKEQTIKITRRGEQRVAKALDISVDDLVDLTQSPYGVPIIEWLNRYKQSMKAYSLFKRDQDYVVKDSQVIIVDEFTGRLMFGRRYSDGLHEAIEAKERVAIKEENQTLATITLQNYFRMYEKLAGMTGTAATEADEFMHIYGLETVVIPTNKPMIRKDLSDVIYKTEEAKFKAVVDDIVERHKRGQPVLVGTIFIEKSERLSKMLKRRGILHQVLNAKYHEMEAQIIAQAGKKHTVTIATNMAGRGVDIILGGNPPDPQMAEEVKQLGGLHVIGTERHEARRIDNQLRGRSGRQGDPGSSQFYISLEDDLMRLFGSDRVGKLMERMGIPDDMPIEHSMITKSIETAQRQVESQNFEIRKHVLEYDDVMNKQREVIYEQRAKCLSGDNLHEEVQNIIEDVIREAIETFTNRNTHPEQWDLHGLFDYIKGLYPLPWGKDVIDLQSLTQDQLFEELLESAKEIYKKREEDLGAETMRELERMIMLQVIDNKWGEHLYEMDYLKEGIGLRAIGQRDPLIEYKNEAFEMFQNLTQSIKEDFIRYIFHVQVVREPVMPAMPKAVGDDYRATPTQPVKKRKIGRNEPCPCGSGKKYKKCCGR